MAEGMRVTLKALPGGLTVDENGKKLLTEPFVFQCPPMDEFKVTHAFSMGNYDTIEIGQFTRRGSRQLDLWQFDTLVMELGVSDDARLAPGWVPFPKFRGSRVRPYAPDWFIGQLRTLHDAGAPFGFTAEFTGASGAPFHEHYTSLGPVLSTKAVLLGFSEGHKHGEGDAIYLEGVSFSEWRDPTITQKKLGSTTDHGKSADTPPTSVTLERNGLVKTNGGHIIPIQPKGKVKQATLADLSKYFFHTPTDWRSIYTANKLKGGGPNTPLVKFSKFHHIGRTGAKIKIPDRITLSVSKGHGPT